MAEQDGGAYDRGVAAGEIAARLAGHDRHFATINGSLAEIARQAHAQADSLHEMALAVQRLADQAVSDASTRITTAAALKDADTARRDKTEQSWSPWAKTFAGIGAVVALVGLYLAFRR